MAASQGILLDTGPLVAYLVADEQHHRWATEQFMRHDGPLITCEAVVSESWFLLRHLPRHLAKLRAMLADGIFDLSFHLEDEAASISALMDRYDDVPMSLADACLVRLSELHPKLPLVTLDSDFKIYRRHGRQMIPVISPS
ncbi:MAG: PIN domain-containing protein [Verrucomicrobiaceae bacterium]|nr:PIN domain-containing protein [Verrucomicrobiaceae bacterium]